MTPSSTPAAQGTPALSLSRDMTRLAPHQLLSALGCTLPDWLDEELQTAPATRQVLLKKVAHRLKLGADVQANVSTALHAFVSANTPGRKRIANRAVLHLIGPQVGQLINRQQVRDIQSIIGVENYAGALLAADAPPGPLVLPPSEDAFRDMITTCLGQWLKRQIGDQRFLSLFLTESETAAMEAAGEEIAPERVDMAFLYATGVSDAG